MRDHPQISQIGADFWMHNRFVLNLRASAQSADPTNRGESVELDATIRKNLEVLGYGE